MTTIQISTKEAVASIISASFIISKEQFQIVKATWASKKEHSAADIITYNLLRGYPVDRGFTPISETNPHKIASNCNDPWWGFTNAKNIAYGNTMVANNRWKSEEENQKITDRHIQRFKEKFGIDLTEDLRKIIRAMALEKQHG